MGTIFKTIREYFDTKKEFIIPNYQRGYKWAVKLSGNPSAVEVLVDDLVNGNQSYFLQGVTVIENVSSIELIDGQQRTITLYLLLWYLGYPGLTNIKLKYDIRTSSNVFLQTLCKHPFSELYTKHEKKEAQDIYYFKEGIGQIHAKLKKLDNAKKQELCCYLLDKVSIIYIKVEPDKAIKTFTMMNGSKATMHKEELVKSEMLRLVSLPQVSDRKVASNVDDNLNDLREIIAKDWETNAFRSLYSREWDKWMQWWNRDEVIEYFHLDKEQNIIGLLLNHYYYQEKGKSEFDDFASFRLLLNDKGSKKVFKELRNAQKHFEDLYNSPIAYNYLQLALICYDNPKDRLDIVRYYIDNKEDDKRRKYALWRLVRATHYMITTETPPTGNLGEKTKEGCAQMVMDHLDENIVYGQYNEDAFRQLLYLNVEQYIKLDEKFNFDIWKKKNRSLEHIYPKSKVWHKEIFEAEEHYVNGGNVPILQEDTTSEGMLDREAFNGNGSEHCIGNLVLLYQNNNSSFSAAGFNDKKQMYFALSDREFFESRHLLHTISYFAEEKWGVEEIQKKKEEFIKEFKRRYNI